jgi:hypothetical protein
LEGKLSSRRDHVDQENGAVAAAIVLSAASASLAKDGGLPSIDIEKLCRADIDALRDVFTTNDKQAMDACVAAQ